MMILNKQVFAGLALSLATWVVQAEPEQVPTPLPAAQAKEGISRGLLMQYQGRMIFSPCRERTYVQLEDLSENQRVTDALRQFGLTDSQPLYVEFIGIAERGTLKAKWLNFVGRQANCQSTANLGEQWRALGADWSFRQGEGVTRLAQAGVASDPSVKAVESTVSRVQTTEQRVDVYVNEGAEPAWTFQRELCRIPGVDTLFGWRANSPQGVKPLQGCAWQGFE